MKFRKILLFAAVLLLLPTLATAQEEGQIYVIKKGDTLWGISERFIKDPQYWPSLWSHNPAIRNPHFIYPGQRVRIYDGRIEILPAEGEEPEAPTQETAPSPPEAPAITVKARGNGPGGFIGHEELDAAGVLLDTVDNRIMMATGDKVFADLRDLADTRPGARFSLFSRGRKVTHPVTDEPVGYLVSDLGSLQVTEVHPEVATAVITSADREIQRGAQLRPWTPRVNEIELKKSVQPLDGVIVAGGQGQAALGQYDYIYVDLGAMDGLETGNLLYVSRPRQATEFGLQGQDVQLPEVLLGSAVVVDTQLNTATALILKIANQPIERGDRVSTCE